MSQYQMGVGLYQTACEASSNRQQIDTWINEEKSNIWISRQLKALYGEQISDKSVGKYRKYREDQIQKELEASPEYQAKVQAMNDQFNMNLGKVKSVDVLARLTDMIDHSAEMLADAKDRDIQIMDVKDMRMVQQTLIDAIKVYGDTVLKAQKVEEINKNPELLRPTTVNVNIRSALTNILREAVSGNGEADFNIVDMLRDLKFGTGTTVDYGTGLDGDSGEYRSSIVDGESQDIEG